VAAAPVCSSGGGALAFGSGEIVGYVRYLCWGVVV
jgi:hypothetical protein